jgi:2-keto-4-pentenoate hydratase/2-oxohepta-3-ene-1,7-dioic acid hydratase in catechol pathway
MKIARVADSTGEIVWVSVQDDGAMLRIEAKSLFDKIKVTSKTVRPQRYLPPVEPTAILCIGLNYRRHAQESGFDIPDYPVVFMKNLSAAIGHNETIRIPAVCGDEVDYECELALVIGKSCCNVSKDNAIGHLLGYTAANDVTARIWQWQKSGTQWCRSKSFDTFAPLGPVLVTPDEIDNPNGLDIKSQLNGKTVQQSNTSDMIFDVPTLISFLSQDTTLLPGTVILTGTPPGIGWAHDPKVLLRDGDTITVEIEKIGCLSNKVLRTGKQKIMNSE